MGERLDLGACPHLWGEGFCAFGCSEEDRCVTDEPVGGWPSAPWDDTGRRQRQPAPDREIPEQS
jgi:hypothetical protein